jgi:hypothetical protein
MRTVGLLAAIVLSAVGLYFYKHPHLKVNNTTQEIAAAQTTYHYQKLENYKLTNGSSSISFDKPTQFEVYGSPKAGDSQVLLIQMSSNHTVPDVGRIAAATVKFPADPLFLKSFGDSLTGTDKAGYDIATKNFRDFINGRLPGRYSLSSFNGFQPFSNPGIAANAWQSGFSATSNKSGLPKISGEFITAFGKQVEYYFMAENVQADWSANQALWQKVTDSLKIDQ